MAQNVSTPAVKSLNQTVVVVDKKLAGDLLYGIIIDSLPPTATIRDLIKQLNDKRRTPNEVIKFYRAPASNDELQLDMKIADLKLNPDDMLCYTVSINGKVVEPVVSTNGKAANEEKQKILQNIEGERKRQNQLQQNRQNQKTDKTSSSTDFSKFDPLSQ